MLPFPGTIAATAAAVKERKTWPAASTAFVTHAALAIKGDVFCISKLMFVLGAKKHLGGFTNKHIYNKVKYLRNLYKRG